ncbi:MAG: 1-deoxy-D-xylulose-5-phosphate synthase [Desulfobacterales bacterium]
MQLLDTINSPADLKTIGRDRLPALAEELRRMIVEVVSKNGGHLSASLGVVELTLAVHYVFNAPLDKIIWDVGHQAYAHKILTDRKDRFHTLRQHNGICGFTRISESPYDAFSSGHSSTSISAGLGIACAKRLKNDAAKVISIIGDGSLTGGVAFEGLNKAGDCRKEDIVVILNDNDMAIAHNVGSLSSFLSRKFSAKYLQNFRTELGDFLKSVPKFGDDIYQFAKRAEESFKTFITPGMLFEALNFEYFGPINGHRLPHLIDILENIKTLRKPVLLHVVTQKGKGYPPAEKNPVFFHGVGCFEVETGNSIKKPGRIPTYAEVFGEAMVRFAARDERIIAVTAAMPEGTGLAEFAEKYPDRFFDVGIAEQHGVSFAAGMASEGFRPVVAVYSTFLQRAYDQILQDVCLDSLPVIFAIDRGGIVGEDGATHHGLFDFSYLRGIPNMTIMAPRNENELVRMMATAFSHNGPIALRYPRGAAIGVDLDENIQPVPIGQAEVLETGDDLLILAIGHGVSEARKARELLVAHNIHPTLVDCRFVKPLDAELIVRLARKIPRIITVEDHMLHGGFGSAVLECLADHGINGCRIRRIGIQDTFVEHGPSKVLRSQYGIDAAAVVRAAESLVREPAMNTGHRGPA